MYMENFNSVVRSLTFYGGERVVVSFKFAFMRIYTVIAKKYNCIT